LLGKTFPNLELKIIKSCYRDIKNQIPNNSVAIGWSNYMLNWLSGIGFLERTFFMKNMVFHKS